MRDRYPDERGARRRARRGRGRGGGGLPAWAWSLLAGGVVVLVVVVVVIAVRNHRGGSPSTTTPFGEARAGEARPTGNVVTRANFDRLRRGMTEAQVREIMGPPTAIDNYDDEKGKSRQLTWKNGGEYITVAFFGGVSHYPTALLGGYYLFGRN